MNGFSYEVSDEQLAAYRALDIDARLRWLDEARRMTYALATAGTKASWRRLRSAAEPDDLDGGPPSPAGGTGDNQDDVPQR